MTQYRLLVHLTGDFTKMEKDMNDLAKEGYGYVNMYENNARLIVVMEKKPSVGRPKKADNGES